MFLMCLVLCFDIFRNPHAQNACATQKVQLLFFNLVPRHGTCERNQVHGGLNSRGNLTEIVTGPLFEAPKMRF